MKFPRNKRRDWFIFWRTWWLIINHINNIIWNKFTKKLSLYIVIGKLNGKLSNKSFAEKKAIMKDKTAFDMNNKINEYQEWRELQLRDRGDKLTDLIVGLLDI